jgi:hypothetical protein
MPGPGVRNAWLDTEADDSKHFLADLTLIISKRLSGVLIANRPLPFGESANGRTCNVSNNEYELLGSGTGLGFLSASLLAVTPTP